MTTTEQWRKVPGFPDYLVSDHGRVVSTKKWRGQVNRELRGHIAPFGYPCVHLYGAGRARNRTARSIHSLVMEAFVGPRPEGMEVCHNDGDSSNARLENLRYDTHAANVQDMVLHGTNPAARITGCIYGHEFTPENTRVYGNHRFCIECDRRRGREYRARKKARYVATDADRAAFDSFKGEPGASYNVTPPLRRLALASRRDAT